MKKHLIAICALLLAGSSLLHAEQVYYCVAEATGGIGKWGGKWVGGRFRKRRHTLKFNEDYTVLETRGTEYICSKVWRGRKKELQHTVICYYARREQGELKNYHDGVFFVFDKKSLSFIEVFAPFTGYLTNQTDTNHIHAGTCEKF